MRNFTRYFGILLLLSLLASCVDNAYRFDNIDPAVQIEAELVAPLAYSKIKVSNVLSDSLAGMELVVDGEEMYILYSDSQYMGNELVEQLKVLPKGNFTFGLTLSEHLAGMHITSGEIIYDETLTFDQLNTNPNERLDSVLFHDSEARITLTVQLPLAEDSYLDVIFDESQLLLDTLEYPGNKLRIPIVSQETRATLNLKKAMLRLNGGQTVSCKLRGYIHATEEFVGGEEIYMNIDFDHVQPHLTYMNIGTARDIYEGTKTIDFDYTKAFQLSDMFLPFYDPQIVMSCVNNIGVPVRYYVDYVEAEDTRTGEKVRADFGDGNPATSVVVGTPSFDKIAHLSKSELLNFDTRSLICESSITFDREYGRTDRLFKINPDRLTYHYRIRSIDDNPNNVHFFFLDSDMTLVEDAKMPLWFEGDADNESKNFYLQRKDTMQLDFSSMGLEEFELRPQTKVELSLSYKNFLPVGVQGHIAFLNDEGQPIMEDANQSFFVKSGQVDEMGRVVASTDESYGVRIALNYEQAQTLMSEAASLVLSYKLSNEEKKNIKLTTNDWMEVKAHLYFDGALVLNSQAKEDVYEN